MSLVNDMLNDLDDRRNQQAREEVNLDWMTGQKQTSKNKWMMPVLALSVVVLFVVVAFAVFRYQDTSNTDTLDKLAAIKQASTVEAEKPVVAEKVKPQEGQPVVVKTAEPERAIAARQPAVAEQEKPVATVAPAKVKPVAKPPVAAKKPIKTPKPLTLAQRDLKASEEAKKLIRNKQSEQAEAKLTVFMRENPLAMRSGKVLASLWLAQEKESQAQQLIIPLRDVAPRDIDLIMIQARLYYARGNAADAINVMKTERPSVNASAGYYELLGFIARSDKQYELSVQAYRRLLEYDATRGDWWVGMAIALDMQNKQVLAKEAYRRGIDSGRISQSLNDYARKRLAAL